MCACARVCVYERERGGGEREREFIYSILIKGKQIKVYCLFFLQDIFWYVFLSNFQPNPAAQQKLFNRTAHNYVKLIFYCKNPLFRDTFLKVGQ